MALNFQGDCAVGVLNDPKNTFNTNDLFRVYDGGILAAGGISVDHGDFVSWDGTKWVREADIKIARSDEITNTNSSIAPEYTKKTYEANSYVMYGGVLYTNENAIGTAEDWNPAHWTQTTVAEMMAGAGDSGYKQVNLIFNQSDSKTIPVGQKEEVHATCTMKANDVVKIQLAEDCTDAVLVLIRQNNTAPANVQVFRGTTNLSFYGRNIVTSVDVEPSLSASQVLLSTNYIEGGDHGGGYYDIPTSFNDTALAGESDFVGSVSVNNLYQKLNAYGGGTFIFEIKGDVVICLPN